MDLNPSIRIRKNCWMNVNQKIMAKSMNKSKYYETYFEFFCWANIEINLSKGILVIIQKGFCDRNFIISNISFASMKLKKLWPNLQIY